MAQTPLFTAACRSRYDPASRQLAEDLLAAGAPLDLFSAMYLGRDEAACAMLEADPAVARKHDPAGWPALHIAAGYSAPEVVEMLVRLGCDVNQSHHKRGTPLFHASSRLANAELLLAHGADIHARCKRGSTVLHSAAASGNLAWVDFLLRHGADPATQTDARQTPWALAVQYGHREVARRLCENRL